MSSHYNLEPQPTASAIIHTTQGELSVELFAKQTPLTCRNFLQHSLDGYYDNTIFHRLIPGFILQGGDPTGTGNGGESIYDGGAFSGDLDPWPMDQRRGRNAGPTGIGMKDEVHSRLKLNRRGLLGMANESSPDTNGSQFFFTLDTAEELTQKNTLFGRIAGDTIYNLAKMGEAEIQEGTDRPTYPVKITHIEILVNPFQDMYKRNRVAKSKENKKSIAVGRKKKKKASRNMLSFGDNEGEEEEHLPILKKPKYDARIVMDIDEENSNVQTKAKPSAVKTEKLLPIKDASSDLEKAATPNSPASCPPPPVQKKGNKSSKITSQESYPLPEPEALSKKILLRETNAEIEAIKASMRRYSPPGPPRQEETHMPGDLADELVPENAVRGRKRKHGVTTGETKAMGHLNDWISKLDKVLTSKKLDNVVRVPENSSNEKFGTIGDSIDEESELCDLHFIANCMSCKSWDKDYKEDSDDEGWMSNALTAAPDPLGKDLSFRKKAEDELIVIDTREKTKNLKEEKRVAREARVGGTGREWDQARNAKLARASALSGRGAR